MYNVNVHKHRFDCMTPKNQQRRRHGRHSPGQICLLQQPKKINKGGNSAKVLKTHEKVKNDRIAVRDCMKMPRSKRVGELFLLI